MWLRANVRLFDVDFSPKIPRVEFLKVMLNPPVYVPAKTGITKLASPVPEVLERALTSIVMAEEPLPGVMVGAAD